MSGNPRISVSVVSHAQGALIAPLLGDLSSCASTPLEVILTLNIPETLPFDPDALRMPVRVLRNARRKGFGANHNAAFRESRADHFCVLNPDIRLADDPFPALLACLAEPDAGVAAPVVRSSTGRVEDSARRFPTPWFILKKALGIVPTVDYPMVSGAAFHPDWIAGMFMLFPRQVFAEIGGFDERYFLYYEDVDLCARLALAGKRVTLCPSATAIHAARRQSRTSLRYLRWHLTSMLRYFTSAPAMRLTFQRFRGKQRRGS